MGIDLEWMKQGERWLDIHGLPVHQKEKTAFISICEGFGTFSERKRNVVAQRAQDYNKRCWLRIVTC